MNPSVSAISVLRFEEGVREERSDLLAAEEPMEIRLGFGGDGDRQLRKISVTMRTPGNDFELAAGFLFTEGILHDYADIASIRYCSDGGAAVPNGNLVRVELTPTCVPDIRTLERNFYTTSSCGVCGKASIDAIRSVCPPPTTAADFSIPAQLLLDLPTILREQQTVFSHTGGLHACAIFDSHGKLSLSREDVGRHNALDKLIGAAWASGQLPYEHHLLLLSGRASFELVQKAAMAGIRFVAAVGAPSSLAVSLAAAAGMTLVGFLRQERFNCYTGKHRINP